jgi:hypothetical protein
MKPALFLLTLLLFSPSLPAAEPPATGDQKSVVIDKAKLQKLTAKPVALDRLMQLMCRSPKDVFGPHRGTEVDVFITEKEAPKYLDPWGKFEVGTLVLKEKRTENGKIELYTGMKKREAGYFPEGGDWEYFVCDEKGNFRESAGKLQSCAECHAKKKDQEFLMRRIDTLSPQLNDGSIVLHSSRATLPEGQRMLYEPQEKKNTLGYWTNPKDFGQWKFLVEKPGTFDVEVLQGCGKGSGGSEVAVSVGKEQVKFTVEDTGHFQNFKARVIGRIKLAVGEQLLEVRPQTKPGAAVMDLRQIRLIPVDK